MGWAILTTALLDCDHSNHWIRQIRIDVMRDVFYCLSEMTQSRTKLHADKHTIHQTPAEPEKFQHFWTLLTNVLILEANRDRE